MKWTKLSCRTCKDNQVVHKNLDKKQILLNDDVRL